MRQSLRRIARILLDDRSAPAALDDAAAELHRLLDGIAGPLENLSDTALPSGKALSPATAAACTKDGLRTAMFLRGARDAIAAASSAGRPCEVVYAGTGPFAPLAVPLMAGFSPAEARFTLLDVHRESVRAVREIVGRFGFEGMVRAVVAADATTYMHDRPIDVAIAEVMQRSLGVEPQVQIVRNLAPQLRDGGLLVPEEIRVDLAVGTPAAGAALQVVGTVARLTSEPLAAERAGRLAPRTIAMPELAPGICAMYVTSLRVFGRHALRAFQSGLTCPEIIPDLASWTAGEEITFWYETGQRPGIRWERRLTPPPSPSP